jgi:Rieske Fe-S protein
MAYAFALSCPHQNTALRWADAEHEFQCPKHHSKYQPDGTFITGRATRNMDRYAISRQGGNVVVDFDTLYRDDEDPKGWTAAAVRLT